MDKFVLFQTKLCLVNLFYFRLNFSNPYIKIKNNNNLETKFIVFITEYIYSMINLFYFRLNFSNPYIKITLEKCEL